MYVKDENGQIQAIYKIGLGIVFLAYLTAHIVVGENILSAIVRSLVVIYLSYGVCRYIQIYKTGWGNTAPFKNFDDTIHKRYLGILAGIAIAIFVSYLTGAEMEGTGSLLGKVATAIGMAAFIPFLVFLALNKLPKADVGSNNRPSTEIKIRD